MLAQRRPEGPQAWYILARVVGGENLFSVRKREIKCVFKQQNTKRSVSQGSFKEEGQERGQNKMSGQQLTWHQHHHHHSYHHSSSSS